MGRAPLASVALLVLPAKMAAAAGDERRVMVVLSASSSPMLRRIAFGTADELSAGRSPLYRRLR